MAGGPGGPGGPVGLGGAKKRLPPQNRALVAGGQVDR